MKLNNLELPKPYLSGIETGIFKRDIGSWILQKHEDAYGNMLETEIGEVFDTIEKIKSETAILPIGFKRDEFYGKPTPDLQGPGAIPDILDFSKIICFAISSDGSPFCFDYRESDIPNIIWWDDTYWRRIAPDFNSFLNLFKMKKSHNL